MNPKHTKEENPPQVAWILIGGLILRLLLIGIGKFVDDYGSRSINYTDIDYNVYTDGARLMQEGYSPYERITFRYPPLIALIMIPNLWFREFGKLLFSIADLGVVYLCFEISQQKCGNWALVSWALNPLVASICTRGSLDSINNFLILYTLSSLIKGNYVISGFSYGLVVYLRLYPIIYFPALLLYSLSHIPPNLRHILLSSSSLSLPLSVRKHSQTSKEKPNPCLERMNFLLKRFKIFPIHSVAIPVTVQFLLSALIAFLVPALISYLQYGDSYLKEAILYHFGRTDPKHNFSPYYLWVYSCEIDRNCLGGKFLFTLVTTIPQLILFTLTTWRLAQRDLPACFLILSFIFVTFNKVCTAQYFTWYACFLPLLSTRIEINFPYRISVALTLCWIVAVGSWLNEAHQLEFLGLNNFLGIWMSSLIFHVVNTLCISFILLNLN